MRAPSVSIVIPCYNSGDDILEAVASAQRQEGNFLLEAIIIVDDGSDDDRTREVLRTLKDLPKVRVIPNHRTKGPGGARNTGLAEVDSEWVAFLDADDIPTPGSIGAGIDGAVDYPSAGWCGGDFVFFFDGESDWGPPVYRSGIKASAAYRKRSWRKPRRP